MDKIYKSNDMENPDDIVVVKLDLKIKKNKKGKSRNRKI